MPPLHGPLEVLGGRGCSRAAEMARVSEHVLACSQIFWPLEGAFDKLELKGALKKGAEAFEKFANGTDKASALLCCSFTPSTPAGELDEDGNEQEPTKCKAAVSCAPPTPTHPNTPF